MQSGVPEMRAHKLRAGKPLLFASQEMRCQIIMCVSVQREGKGGDCAAGYESRKEAAACGPHHAGQSAGAGPFRRPHSGSSCRYISNTDPHHEAVRLLHV